MFSKELRKKIRQIPLTKTSILSNLLERGKVK